MGILPVQFQILDPANTAFMLLCTSLVMLMTPGLAFAGLVSVRGTHHYVSEFCLYELGSHIMVCCGLFPSPSVPASMALLAIRFTMRFTKYQCEHAIHRQ